MSPDYLHNPYVVYPALILLGLCFGSLITLLSYRLPRDLPVGATRSRCPYCDTKLTAHDLIPVLSYLLAQARCRYCLTSLSWRYPAIELVTAVMFVLVWWLNGPGWHTVILLGLAVCVLTIIVTDLEHYLIPDELQIAIAVLGLADMFVSDKRWDVYLITALVAGGLAWGLRVGFRIVRKKEGLGLGDVKFFAVAGLWLGPHGFVMFMLLAGVIGILTALLWRLLGRGEYFPFGPALALALLVCASYPALIMWIS